MGVKSLSTKMAAPPAPCRSESMTKGYYAIKIIDTPTVPTHGGLQLPAVIFTGGRNMRIDLQLSLALSHMELSDMQPECSMKCLSGQKVGALV
jgi:hypothetical protein